MTHNKPWQAGILSGALCVLSACGTSVKEPSRQDQSLQALSNQISSVSTAIENTNDPVQLSLLQQRLTKLSEDFENKRYTNALAHKNMQEVASALEGHTTIYPLSGGYKVLVIPVQFSDFKFERPEAYQADKFGRVPAYDYLFGNHKDSLTNYYRHASKGVFNVEGEITPIVTVDKDLAFYGEAVTGATDKNARSLVVDALLKVKERHSGNNEWWEQFDNWDMNDYDSDKNFHEPDGFVDAVVLIYAGKSQASCQRAFDPEGTRPATAEVEEGPRHDATVECFNRLWPHRWSLSLTENDPNRSTVGPVVEGTQRPSFNSMKLTDNVYAFDYNMQSEFSDRSTFMHEFGHSLSLPDVYAYSGENSTGQWELMSSNARLQAQELSSFSKLSLGWVMPKVIKQGETTSAYLGNYNFVANKQRDDFFNYIGPETIAEPIRNETHTNEILSTTPSFGEGVYRSVAVITDPSREHVEVVKMPENGGKVAAYSDRYDGDSRNITLKLNVPEEGDATLTFETYYHIETETNWGANEEEVRVTTDYDLGAVKVDGELLESLRLISGDTDYDSLAELNPECEAARVLELRLKKIAGTLGEEESSEFKTKTDICQKPVWVTKSYDLSAHRGKEVVLEIEYVTDGGYTELGIIVDNVRLGETLYDFENSPEVSGGFVLLHEGNVEKRYQQLYLFEYRDPQEEYKGGVFNRELSYNMDQNIANPAQGMFVEGEGSLLDRFRVVTWDYQPGVVVWYFNNKYGRTENNPSTQEGKGYLLVLNSKVQEAALPGVFASEEWFDENGVYKEEDESFKALVDEQTLAFKCFSHIDYATYIDGVAPDCSAYPTWTHDLMQRLNMFGKKLIFRREGFNNLLPVDQYGYYGINTPFTNTTANRTGLGSFRPATAENFKPFKVYKYSNKGFVIDEVLTNSAASFAPVSKFSDQNNSFPTSKRLQEDTVVVEKAGFSFEVTEPSSRVVRSYDKNAPAEANANWHRRPRAKLNLKWE